MIINIKISMIILFVLTCFLFLKTMTSDGSPLRRGCGNSLGFSSATTITCRRRSFEDDSRSTISPKRMKRFEMLRGRSACTRFRIRRSRRSRPKRKERVPKLDSIQTSSARVVSQSGTTPLISVAS
jgi:hypothetical protein